MKGWLERLRRQGWGAQSAVLALAVLAVYGVVAPVAKHLDGLRGLGAAAVAAGLCLLGAGSALVAGRRLRGPNDVLLRLLVGMPLRMGLPLAIGLMCHFRGGVLAEAGLLYYLLVFYPVTLGVETTLSLPSAERPSDCTRAS
jgi:hypothetical protein